MNFNEKEWMDFLKYPGVIRNDLNINNWAESIPAGGFSILLEQSFKNYQTTPEWFENMVKVSNWMQFVGTSCHYKIQIWTVRKSTVFYLFQSSSITRYTVKAEFFLTVRERWVNRITKSLCWSTHTLWWDLSPMKRFYVSKLENFLDEKYFTDIEDIKAPPNAVPQYESLRWNLNNAHYFGVTMAFI